MCGIAGFAGAGTRDDLQRMTDVIAHRGPDGEGHFVDHDAAVFLGHRRLSIVDIAGGDQPMADASGRYQLIYNGELYNAPDLRPELESLGCQFHSDHSDTEVVLYALAKWGREALSRFNGMFAFAFYDKAAGTILLARDRFGEKPLFYSSRPGAFVFGSEASAVLAHPDVPSDLSPDGLQMQLAYGYLPGEVTPYKAVEKLPAASSLLFDLKTGDADIRPYWQFQLSDAHAGLSEHEAADRLYELITRSVGRRLLSDVPVGLFLSGGLDSSSIASALSDLGEQERIPAFTIGFSEASYDESGYARTVADHFGLMSKTKILGVDEARDIAGDVLARLDDPIADPSILPTFLLSRFCAEHSKVALGGDGGDELLGGYDPLDAIRYARWYDRLVPGPLHKVIKAAAGALPKSGKRMSFDFKLRRAVAGMEVPWDYRLPRWMAPLDVRDIEEILNAPADPEQIYRHAIDLYRQTQGSHEERFLTFFTRYYLTDDILVKSDRAGMMNGLEARAIFLDNDLADFCAGLPLRLKYKHGNRKIALKAALSSRLPDQIINRRKSGFGIPLADWIEDFDEKRFAVPGFDPQPLRQMLASHVQGGEDHRLGLFAAYVLNHSLRD